MSNAVTEKPKQAAKKSREFLEKAFPKAYVENGLNGTKAYKALKASKNDKVAQVQASRLLSKDIVQKGIQELLPSVERSTKLLDAAFAAEKPIKMDWRDAHKFLETDLKLRGLLKDKDTSQNLNVNMVIQAPQPDITPHEVKKEALE